MSSQAPAVREMPSQDQPTVTSLDRLSNAQIRYIASTEIVPKHLRGKPDAMLATILKGRALGFDDIHSLTAINFIDGKATLSGEAMLALIRQKGHSLQIELKPGEGARATGTRKDNGDTLAITWTMGMAKDAGLLGKDNWKRYPDTMLQWRAVSQVCRLLFPDVLMGVSYTEDEALEASERGKVTQAVSDLPAVEEQHVRTEPLAGPTEAQLNRIAALEQRTGDDGYKTVLRGVFGVEMATELHSDAATQYEAMLEMALLHKEPAEDPHDGLTDSSEKGSAEAEPSSAGQDSDAEGTDDAQPSANHLPAADEPSASEDLPDEPAAPETDETVEGEVVEDADERLVELAAETLIPIGQFKDKPLGEIHDSWIEYALGAGASKIAAYPTFVEALNIYVPARRPALWEKAGR